MPRRIDIAGMVFGRLTALSFHGQRNKRSFWVFRCSCGIVKAIDSNHARYGRIMSCGGCIGDLRAAHARKHLTQYCGSNATHGMSKSPVYFVWKSMIQRCTNPNNKDYKHYGARGIGVCDRWRDFSNFYADMKERPQGLTLERINVNKGYAPENCEWATWQQQNRNKR